MEATISGVYSSNKKKARRQRALERLQVNLKDYEALRQQYINSLKDPLQKAFAPDLTEADVTADVDLQIARVKKEISILQSKI